jgi:hypothetical protein
MSSTKTVGDSLLFDAFWAAYPRKDAKLAARKAFDKAKPTPELVTRMLDALAWQVHRPQWVKDHGQYVPLPATWLHRGQWLDTPPEQPLVTDHEFFRVHGFRRPS